jgi:hypothetical protein
MKYFNNFKKSSGTSK